jgi:hypothetical protein
MPRRTRELTPQEQEAQWLAEYQPPRNGSAAAECQFCDFTGSSKEMMDHRAATGHLVRLAAPQKPIAPPQAPKVTGKAALVYEAAKRCGKAFTEQELTVEAWYHWESDFGLVGFEGHYPDRHLVRCWLYGPRGLFTRGLLRKRPDGLLEVV